MIARRESLFITISFKACSLGMFEFDVVIDESLLVIFFIGIGTAFAGILNLPKRVEKVEKKTEVTDNSVQQLSKDIGVYIAKQEVMRGEQDKREQLMLELIRKKK